MDIKYNTKNIGPKAADFIARLYDEGKTIFTTKEAARLLKLEDKVLQKLLNPLVTRGILTRLIPGLYSIVPFEFGSGKEYMANPYVIAREIVNFKLGEPRYYISHASAMEFHQMVTQPQLVVYASVPKQIKKKINIMGTEFHFVTTKEEDFFGFKKAWINKSEMIFISDIEKTIIDSLKIPEYSGGMTEVAKGFWMKRKEINPIKLLEYAKKLGNGAVYRRLGYLLEVYKIVCPEVIAVLQEELTGDYQLLDPTMLKEGKHMSRWKLRLNVPESEFLSVVRT